MHYLQQKKIGTHKKEIFLIAFHSLPTLLIFGGHYQQIAHIECCVYNASGFIDRTETHSWQRWLRELGELNRR